MVTARPIPTRIHRFFTAMKGQILIDQSGEVVRFIIIPINFPVLGSSLRERQAGEGRLHKHVGHNYPLYMENEITLVCRI